MVYPIVVDRSEGAHLWDIDGNAGTICTSPSAPRCSATSRPSSIEAISGRLARGMEIGPTSPLAGEVAALLCELTGLERATFCNTGSEAVMGALRIARTVTGRQRIVYFSESYHGIADEVLGRRAGERAVPIAPGIAAGGAGECAHPRLLPIRESLEAIACARRRNRRRPRRAGAKPAPGAASRASFCTSCARSPRSTASR